ncbi:hypothetical protein NIES4071_07180 [Calothrix sp. NIES-4071]|nr:hypothetical protein NIES4071_07180 [Calothrix sp. NIES-4071]BAZ55060.1 hypothetical protein NIES4105_07140 [Calothrix sp. NIES-4105]
MSELQSAATALSNDLPTLKKNMMGILFRGVL